MYGVMPPDVKRSYCSHHGVDYLSVTAYPAVFILRISQKFANDYTCSFNNERHIMFSFIFLFLFFFICLQLRLMLWNVCKASQLLFSPASLFVLFVKVNKTKVKKHAMLPCYSETTKGKLLFPVAINLNKQLYLFLLQSEDTSLNVKCLNSKNQFTIIFIIIFII